MGSPLAVFLALRGIRPGNTGSQDHILPREICNRLLNIFHPTDPVVSFSMNFLDSELMLCEKPCQVLCMNKEIHYLAHWERLCIGSFRVHEIKR